MFGSSGQANISVSGDGLITGTTGKRWWDSSQLTHNGIVTGVAGSQIVLPFKRDFIANFYVDLIAKVTIDGRNYLYGASNSPDNLVANEAPSNTQLYWFKLLCTGESTTLGNSNTNNNYMQGGTASNPGGNTLQSIFLLEPAPVAGVFNLSVECVQYNGLIRPFFTKTVNYTAGQLVIPAVSLDELNDYWGNLNPDANPVRFKGFYKFSIANPNPIFRSLLNFYHWGRSNVV